MAPQKKTLYDRVVQVCEEYLGPAGERFVRRQIDTHLDIEPEELQPKHLSKLAKWIALAFALLSDDKDDLDNLTADILTLKVEPSSRT